MKLLEYLKILFKTFEKHFLAGEKMFSQYFDNIF